MYEEKEKGDYVSDSDASFFLELFQGRENIWAKQWVSRNGLSGYSPQHERLSEEIIKKHISGEITAGVYVIHLDNTVSFFALDLDIKKDVLEEARSSPEKAREIKHMVQQTTRLLSKEMSKFFDFALEFTGGRGAHFWFFLEEPEEAKLIWEFGEVLKSYLKDFVPVELSIEFFPKQPKAEKLGNLIKLPLGIHRATGIRSYFMDKKELSRVGNPFDYLRKIRKIKKEEVLRAKSIMLASIAHKTDNPKKLQSYVDIHESDFDYDDWENLGKGESGKEAEDEEGEITGGLEESEEHQERGSREKAKKGRKNIIFVIDPLWTEADFLRPKLKEIFDGCEVLSALKDKATRTRKLTHDEALVLSHTLGYIPEGVMAVNYIFSLCSDSIPENMFLKSTLKGNPISCNKIKKKLPYICAKVNCNCTFPKSWGYPTPVLHAKKASRSKEDLEGEDEGEIQSMLSKFIKLHNLSEDIEEQKRKVASRIIELLSKEGRKQFEYSDVVFSADSDGRLIVSYKGDDNPILIYDPRYPEIRKEKREKEENE